MVHHIDCPNKSRARAFRKADRERRSRHQQSAALDPSRALPPRRGVWPAKRCLAPLPPRRGVWHRRAEVPAAQRCLAPPRAPPRATPGTAEGDRRRGLAPPRATAEERRGTQRDRRAPSTAVSPGRRIRPTCRRPHPECGRSCSWPPAQPETRPRPRSLPACRPAGEAPAG